MRPLIAVVAILAILASIAAALAARNQGGSGLGFSCDVNTRKCVCDGIWEGADCQAMKKNCDLTKPTACTINPPYECSCAMAKASPRPKVKIQTPLPPAAVKP